MKTFKALAMCIIMANTVQANTYTITDVGVTGTYDYTKPQFQAYGGQYMNDNKRVVGHELDANGKPNAFYYDGTKDVLESLMALDSIVGLTNSQVFYGVNFQNYIFNTDTGNTSFLPASIQSVNAVNAKGQYVGIYNDKKVAAYSFFYDGTANRALAPKNVRALSDDGTYFTGQNGTQAYLLHYGSPVKNVGTLGPNSISTTTSIIGATSVGLAVNNNGVVVGDSDINQSCMGAVDPTCEHAFFYGSRGMTDIGTLMTRNQGYSHALAVNNHDVVVGYSKTDRDCSFGNSRVSGTICPSEAYNYSVDHAFVYNLNNGGITDLNSISVDPQNRHWIIQRAVAIKDDGTILANAYSIDDNQQHALILTVNGLIAPPKNVVPVTPVVPDIALTMVSSASSVIAGNTATFTTTVTNTIGSAKGVTTTFSLPPNMLQIVSVDPADTRCSFANTLKINAVTCNYDTMIKGQVIKNTITVKALTLVSGGVNAKFVGTMSTVDPTPANNSLSVVMSITKPAASKVSVK